MYSVASALDETGHVVLERRLEHRAERAMGLTVQQRAYRRAVAASENGVVLENLRRRLGQLV